MVECVLTIFWLWILGSFSEHTWIFPLRRLQVPVLGNSIKTRTGLHRIQVMMPHNQGFRETGVHTLHQLTQGFHLLLRARVRRTALRVKAAFIADADAVSVMSCTVGTHLVEPASRLYSSIPADDEMVAN